LGKKSSNPWETKGVAPYLPHQGLTPLKREKGPKEGENPIGRLAPIGKPGACFLGLDGENRFLRE